ncbi:GAF domain-containing protein [Saccharopolyspora erythraea NRRL 2338]|uniref:Response regulator receiver and ANTAR domain protein n=2 Tax=Saccharopolyspora erythraea TaxID=1836 RepID=A4FAY9_SACEN|nr:GAF and ANTAR domain-containing protein [Saccharopolyspora erythraea]EQD87595.1 hisitidine kinase [Saccharopolyspora erythraea D]PFG94998.1 GAF domain-containing protein [Saccharopolyspora erythraea NRRL 2338]QRK91687.1 GAF and ANTAR domain-containing protein [Saccharopolyspora erythraea]CAM01214.1 response regulator receiver and ANTAR domain protein [Saccharopolyspora erythraea NRRL 2338]
MTNFTEPRTTGRGRDGEGPDWEELVAQCTELAASLSSEGTVYGVLRKIVDTAVVMVPGADLASVTLRTSTGEFTTPVHTGEPAAHLDELQYRFDEGPCVHASRDNGPGLAASGDLAADAEWPRWGPAAADAGVRSVLAIGLFPTEGADRIGALNLYSERRRGLHDADRTSALLLASHASIALDATKAVSTAELQAAHLRRALESRDVIGQAKGILMHRQGISAAEAFDLLRRTSQQLNVKLARVAETLVERRGEL